jgi:asparagine synthase (glutamine-hydrolysing)
MQKAKELGADVVITGDGADELMGGYSFHWGLTDEELWVKKRNDLAVNMNFATPALAEACGLTSESPYLEDSFIEWVTASTSRSDCIAERPIELCPTAPEERTMHITGKVCLRDAFPDSGSAHRRKDPIEVGSGATLFNVDKSSFFESIIPKEEFEAERDTILREDRVAIRDAEHLFYYRAFKKCFPADVGLGIERFGSNPCVACGYQLRKKEEMFCHVCGAWPARHP